MGETEETVPYLNQRAVTSPEPSADVIMFLKRFLSCTADEHTGNMSKPAKRPVESNTSLLKKQLSGQSLATPPRDTERLAIQLAMEDQSNTVDHLSFGISTMFRYTIGNPASKGSSQMFAYVGPVRSHEPDILLGL